MSKRNVFLFGAGATYAWGSPSTLELTALIRSEGFRTSDNKTTITEFIFQQLVSGGYQEIDINFETIINVIEELIVYYSYFNAEKRVPSLLTPFFTPKFENELFNFSIPDEEPQYGYKMQIPKGVSSDYTRRSGPNETPRQFYLQYLLSHLLTHINAKISSYAYHTSANSKIVNQGRDEVTSMFTQWMRTLSANGILRMYTLNYERIFKIILERANIHIFEGFECGEYIDAGVNLRANVPRILSDTDSHTHYNLHGSAFWEVQPLDDYQLPNPETFLTGAPVLPLNYDQASLQVEKGKTLVVTNIITGYQKSQKSMTTPIKQMQSAFDNDCCFANNIYVIGYSFGDEHINAGLKAALRYNRKAKLIVIDPYFIKNQMDSELVINFFPYGDFTNLKPKMVDQNQYSYLDGAFTVHVHGFKEFLELQTRRPNGQ